MYFCLTQQKRRLNGIQPFLDAFAPTDSLMNKLSFMLANRRWPALSNFVLWLRAIDVPEYKNFHIINHKCC